MTVPSPTEQIFNSITRRAWLPARKPERLLRWTDGDTQDGRAWFPRGGEKGTGSRKKGSGIL
jgi:hypothetical protein